MANLPHKHDVYISNKKFSATKKLTKDIQSNIDSNFLDVQNETI